jgi:alkylation response protein AidB-like acyl-CoA dehydrogenase
LDYRSVNRSNEIKKSKGSDSIDFWALGARVRFNGHDHVYALRRIMLETVLTIFSVLTAACGIGFMEAATAATCAHASSTRVENLGANLAELPTIRAYAARMRIATDQARCLWHATLPQEEGHIRHLVDAVQRFSTDATLHKGARCG